MVSHRGCEERGVAEDIEDILAGRHEECLSLTNLYAVDVRLAPQTDDNDKRIDFEVYLCRNLHHHSVDVEIRAVDEL